jgi:hypothetical protein
MPNFDDLFVVIEEGADTLEVRQRAPAEGMDIDAIRRHRIYPRQFRIRSTISQALAAYLVAIRFPVDVPIAPGVLANLPAGQAPIPQVEIHDFIPAEIYKNVFWGLTSDDLFQDHAYEGSLVGFLSDAGSFDLRARQDANQQVTTVEVVVDSSPARTALDTAMRVWSLFFTPIGFTVESELLDTQTGQRLKVRQPDLAVQRCVPVNEPRILERVGSGRAKAGFTLMAKYTRFI